MSRYISVDNEINEFDKYRNKFKVVEFEFNGSDSASGLICLKQLRVFLHLACVYAV